MGCIINKSLTFTIAEWMDYLLLITEDLLSY